MTVEEVPNHEGEAIGGTTISGGILEDTQDDAVEEDPENRLEVFRDEMYPEIVLEKGHCHELPCTLEAG